MYRLLSALTPIHDKDDYREKLLPITRIMYEAGLLENCEMYILPPFYHFLVFKKNDRIFPFFDVNYPINSANGIIISGNKHLASSIISKLGYPSTQGVSFHAVEEIDEAIRVGAVPLPAVVKPSSNSLKGKGVLTNIQSLEEVKTNAIRLLETYSGVVIEKFFRFTNEYRILVLDGTIIDVVQRIPAYVIGNGTSTIAELIDLRNAQRKEKGDPPIRIDHELIEFMKATNIQMDSVPAAAAHIRLKNVCNYAAGGDIEPVTATVSAEMQEMVRTICAALDLRIAGLDYMCNDITQPPSDATGIIIEVNPNPDVAMHGYHDPKKSIMIAQKIVQSMFRYSHQ